MKTLITILMVFCAFTAMAIKPQWMHKTPKEGNSSYVFVPITVDASNLTTGRKRCLDMLSLDRGLLNSLKIQYRSEDKTVGHSQVINGQFSENLDIETVEVTTFEGKPIQLKAEIVDSYLDNKNNQFTTLYRVGVVDEPYFDNLECTTSYASDRNIWGLSLVPGAAQFYKGSTLKGSLILGGTVVLVGGTIYTETMRKDYMNKIVKTHNTENIRAYKTRADNFAVGRNICISALGALYVYNIIDAIVAPGARRILVHKTSKGGSYSFLPTVSDNGGLAVAGSIVF